MNAERRLQRQWQKFCEAAVQAARDEGATDPQIYIEAEAGFYVVDGDAQESVGDGDLRPRQDRVVFSLGWPYGVKADCGAW